AKRSLGRGQALDSLARKSYTGPTFLLRGRVTTETSHRHPEGAGARKAGFPVFDADNHMYETTDAFTKYLPSQYDGLVKYVQVNGRTKIALRNQISEYIPNPTFNKVSPPGHQEMEFRLKNPSSKHSIGTGFDP